MLGNVIIVLILVAVVALDIRYIVRTKKSGKCLGCSESGCSCKDGKGTCQTAQKFKKYHEEQAKMNKA